MAVIKLEDLKELQHIKLKLVSESGTPELVGVVELSKKPSFRKAQIVCFAKKPDLYTFPISKYDRIETDLIEKEEAECNEIEGLVKRINALFEKVK